MKDKDGKEDWADTLGITTEQYESLFNKLDKIFPGNEGLKAVAIMCGVNLDDD